MRSFEQLSPPLRAALARVRTALSRRFGLRLSETVLFGSHARGEATEDSDVDLLVVVDGLTSREKLDALEVVYRAALDEDADWCPVIPMVMATADAAQLRSRERLLMHEIDRDGVRL